MANETPHVIIRYKYFSRDTVPLNGVWNFFKISLFTGLFVFECALINDIFSSPFYQRVKKI